MEFDKLAKAKTRIAMEQPFFSPIAQSVRYIEADWCETAATDGINIYYNKKWFDEVLTVSEVAGVIVHEVLHIIWLHPLRRGHRDPMLWNIATDYVINPVIEGLPKDSFKLPGGEFKPLLDPKYKDWSAYEVYNDLMKNAKKITINFPSPNGQPQDGNDKGDGKGKAWGSVIDPTDAQGNPLSESEIKELESEINITVESAIRAAKQIGKVPGGLEKLFEAREKPKINWHEYIQQWVQGTNPDDYTWQRPNRTMMANFQIFQPRIKSMGSGHGVLSIDTSGSVSDEELVAFVTEIMGVINLTRPERLTIIQHDSVVQRIDEWNGEEFSSLKIKGRGGTCVAPSFKAVENLEYPVDWFIGFSDMEINDYPKVAPDYPVLWCATGDGIAPFGETIRLRHRYE